MRSLGHAIIEDNLSTEEYEEFREKLLRLSVEQLSKLMELVGIEFSKTAKWEAEDFIGVLDEAYWDEFEQGFMMVTGKSFNNF